MKILCCVLLLTPFALAQTRQSAPPPIAPAASSTVVPSLTPAKITEMENKLQDWPDLARYRTENAALPAPAPEENRVVFMGDSITDAWGHDQNFFPGKPYVNRGISGQTTPQMLVRFRPDVIDLQPKVVVILAGTNDIAGNTGPSTPEMIQDNLMSMVDLAKENHIRVVLASILPAANYPWIPGIEPVATIRALNRWMQDYCAKNDCVYLDYYSAMADSAGGMKRELTLDGVHPNPSGYRVMAPLAEKAISQALSAK